MYLIVSLCGLTCMNLKVSMSCWLGCLYLGLYIFMHKIGVTSGGAWFHGDLVHGLWMHRLYLDCVCVCRCVFFIRIGVGLVCIIMELIKNGNCIYICVFFSEWRLGRTESGIAVIYSNVRTWLVLCLGWCYVMFSREMLERERSGTLREKLVVG